MKKGEYRHSEEIKIKMKKNHADFSGDKHPLYGKHLSVETRKKIGLSNSISHKGIKFTDEHRKNIGLSLKGRKKSIEHNKHNSEAHRGLQVKEKNPNWQGGKSFEPYSVDWIDKLRESIRERDYCVCQICGLHQDELVGYHKHLDVHHIDYNKNNCNPNNLITLCKDCHGKTNHNRKYWIDYFNNEE